VLVPSRVVTNDVGSNQVDFRGQPLSAVYRFLLDKGLDVVLEVSEETATGRVKPSLISRPADPVTLPIEQFAEWEINYDAAGVQNRLLLVPTDAEIYKNLLTVRLKTSMLRRGKFRGRERVGVWNDLGLFVCGRTLPPP
jgi:hypothetical protein